MDPTYKFTLNNNYPNGTDPKNPIRIYTDGVFDMFHYGHARLFEKVKKMFPYVHLIVGVCKDEDIKKAKAMPVMNDDQRKESVVHCKWVDEVVTGPWLYSTDFLDSINAHYVAHDPEPYPCNGVEDVYKVFKDSNRFIATTRTEGISTTDLIAKIVENYDVYVERSLKKNVPIENLHLSASKYLKIKSEKLINDCFNLFTSCAKEVYNEDKTKIGCKEFLEYYEKMN